VPQAEQRYMVALGVAARMSPVRDRTRLRAQLVIFFLLAAAYDSLPSNAFDWHFVISGSGSSSTLVANNSPDKMSLDVEMDPPAKAAVLGTSMSTEESHLSGKRHNWT
jgi:hypothetical protein